MLDYGQLSMCVHVLSLLPSLCRCRLLNLAPLQHHPNQGKGQCCQAGTGEAGGAEEVLPQGRGGERRRGMRGGGGGERRGEGEKRGGGIGGERRLVERHWSSATSKRHQVSEGSANCLQYLI